MDHMPYREKHSVKNHSIEELKAKGYFETKKLPNGSQKDSIQAES
jgi:NAD-specific glutamate dehydrogenase